MYKSKAITDAQTLEQVVYFINSGGTVEGMEGVEFSPEALAGQYALDAARAAADMPLCRLAIISQLEILEEAGAFFDEKTAVEQAIMLVGAAE